MKNTIDIEVKREQTSIEKLIYDDDNEEQMDDPYCGDGHTLAGKAREALGIKEKEGGVK